MGRDGRMPMARIIGPDGDELTIADLPPRDTKRWVSRRKATVVMAVEGGLITLADACMRYSLSIEEFLSWQRTVERFGIPGLRVTHSRQYRAGMMRN